MIHLRICIKQVPGGRFEMGSFLEEHDTSSPMEREFADVVLCGIKVVAQQITAISSEAFSVELDDPNSELVKRIRKEFNPERAKE
jgi:hypothetical protein